LKKKNNADKITQSLHLYFSGVSLRKSQAHLGVFYPHNASHMTILRWIREYSNLVGNFVDNLKVQNSDSISFDEMEYKTKGKQSFFIDVIDMETRYILSSGYYYSRGMDEMREVLHNAKFKSLNKTSKFFTDGLLIYPQALKKEYNQRPFIVGDQALLKQFGTSVTIIVQSTHPKGAVLLSDETEIDRGRNNDVFWCSVDWGTRFINATLYSPNNQNIFEATRFFEKVKITGTPKFVQTDSASFYPEAFKNVFGRKVKHFRNNVSETGKHNVRIETVFMKIKDRVNDFRGLKALWSAPILMAGIVLQHNFIEQHTTTGQIPSELAGLKLTDEKNRWLGLIKLASQ